MTGTTRCCGDCIVTSGCGLRCCTFAGGMALSRPATQVFSQTAHSERGLQVHARCCPIVKTETGGRLPSKRAKPAENRTKALFLRCIRTFTISHLRRIPPAICGELILESLHKRRPLGQYSTRHRCSLLDACI